jgi:hypothetical protein
MNDYSQMEADAARIAGLTLPPGEVEFRAFDLIELQGYVELADHGAIGSDCSHQTTTELSFRLGSLAEPSSVLKLHVDAS